MHPVIFWMQDGRHVFYDITGGAAGHAPPPTNVLIQVSYVAIGGAAAHAIPHNEGLFMDVYIVSELFLLYLSFASGGGGVLAVVVVLRLRHQLGLLPRLLGGSRACAIPPHVPRGDLLPGRALRHLPR